MKESDIDRLLRQQSPDLPPPPGLKTRVCSSLRSTPRKKRMSPAWLALPVTLLILFVVSRAPRPDSPNPPLPLAVESSDPAPEIPDSIDSAENVVVGKLNEESQALGRTTRRTTRFLLDRLPGLSIAEQD